MNGKSKLAFCLCALLLVGMTGCRMSGGQREMYDNADEIARQGDSYTYKNRSCDRKSEDKMLLTYGSFSGTDTIWVIDSQENGEFTVDYDSTVHSGNLKAVLAYPDTKEVDTVFEGTEQNKKTIKLKKGECRMKLVGKEAGGELTLSISGDKNIEKITAQTH